MMRPTRGTRPLEQLRTDPFTYTPVGGTSGPLPAGFHHLARSRVVGQGEREFQAAAHAVMRWQAQRGSGVRVECSADEAAPEVVLRLHVGFGRFAVAAPARVIYVVDEPRRRGFAYGTLPGHPESGEESFVVELGQNGAVVFTVTAFSRPGSRLTRLAGPVNRLFQRLMAGRYLAAVQRAVQASRSDGPG